VRSQEDPQSSIPWHQLLSARAVPRGSVRLERVRRRQESSAHLTRSAGTSRDAKRRGVRAGGRCLRSTGFSASFLPRHPEPVDEGVFALGRHLARVEIQAWPGFQSGRGSDFAQTYFLADPGHEFPRADYLQVLEARDRGFPFSCFSDYGIMRSFNCGMRRSAL